MKTKKRKKVSRMHGKNMGTHGTGARKNKRKSGNRGGIGMSGSGKRADHKKTLITKLYGNTYFGKKGITSRGSQKDKRERINLEQIENNLDKYGKKTSKGWEINLPKHKVLGKGDVKEKLIISCLEASKSALEKVKNSGGEIVVREVKKIETPKVEHPKKKV